MINTIDGSEMVLIPAGEFIMGSDEYEDEKPLRTVYLDSYEIGKYLITVVQYRKFCEATAREMPGAPKWGWRDDHPIVNVTWFDAESYCKWAGGRLPTEAEWEKAARGTDGREYPWGNTWDEGKCANTDRDRTSTVSAGSYPAGASPYGCMDMAGNVCEWCADWYGRHNETSPSRNPKGPSRGRYRVLRGKVWSDPNYYRIINRCAERDHDGNPNHCIGVHGGFRLAR